MSNDSSFFTNEPGATLADRFGDFLKDTELFDALVGYFYSSGFHAIYPSLKGTDNIRILIGISTSQETFNLIHQGNQVFQDEVISDAQTKERVGQRIEAEMADSEDSKVVENGVQTFIEWIKSGKLVIKAHKSQNIHAKLYIMTFKEGDRDKGRVITGSSNFSRSGLIDKLEFNVELKDRSDYDFAKGKFDELWLEAVDVSQKYVDTIEDKTWFSEKITPYQLYLKFLYEYFKSELNQSDEVILPDTPHGFLELEYQTQAVLNAKKILLEYGGVFISDVVGLGKTFISAMLAKQLEGSHLVIAPPVLLDENNPGSWRNAFEDFGVRQSTFKSIGKLDDLVDGKADKFQNVFIDEAHRMRNATTATYEKLAEICRGKRVILVSATPYNNSPKDILALVQLFQKPRNSTIPNLSNLETFFNALEKDIKKEDRRVDYPSFLATTQANSKAVREKVLKYLMVRRTRSDIQKYFSKDLENQRLKFPIAMNPKPLYYQLSDAENAIFDKTIALIAKDLNYARYKPMTYYEGEDYNESALQGQINLGGFMKILLVKRLESSFFAFKQSIDRFVRIYEIFIDAFESGSVYTSQAHSNKILDMLESDNEEAIGKLLEDDKAQRYDSKDFNNKLLIDLNKDLMILQEVKDLWRGINRDPKLEKFIAELETHTILKDSHLIIFTESKETARYLFENIEVIYPGKVICYDGSSSAADKQKVINNFDAKVSNPENEYRILIATEVLAEGVNLHRSNVVINYDIPWNPTRLMQRVGRINRIDTKFDEIHTFNFFPSIQGDNQIALKEAAQGKIAGFLSLLGGDASLLTDGEEIDSHSLFDKLNTIKDEDEPDTELKYLKVIKDIRENNPDLFNHIKQLPRKARTAKMNNISPNSFITYFRLSRIQKFFIADQSEESKELDFMDAASLIESKLDTQKEKIPGEMFDLLDKNSIAFNDVLEKGEPESKSPGGADTATKLLKHLKHAKRNSKQFTDDQEAYLNKAMIQIGDGALPKKTLSNALDAILSLEDEISNPLKVLGALQISIPEKFLEDHYAESNITGTGITEVVLSMYLKGN
ncbi:helicase-related protein [Candidatus Thioglobus sp.]|nr:helicase-related protein [Candidatus Thioglobus sp.]